MTSKDLPPPPPSTEKEVVYDGADKHVVPPARDNYPEAIHYSHKNYPEVAPTTAPETLYSAVSPISPWAQATTVGSFPPSAPDELPPRQKRRIGRKTIYAIIIVVVVIIAAAVGGGVGAVTASKSKNTESSATSSSAPAPVSTTPSTPPSVPASSTSVSATSTSASASATPSVHFLNNETWPSGNTWAFQGFSRSNYTGLATPILSEGDGSFFDFDLHSYVWIQNIGNCCVNFCANATKAGNVGYACGKKTQPDSSISFSRVHIWCSDHPSNSLSAEKGCS